jgi:arylsulfatase A-like enzyme
VEKGQFVNQETSITRRAFLSTTAAAATATAAARPQGPPQSAAAQPNILHIMVDQMQWAAIARRTICRTPNINRLAEGGLLFERSYTPSAVCCPARAMLITGAYHWHNGVYNQVHSSPSVSRSMFKDAVTYSARLRDAGYRQGLVGKWHADFTRTPLDFGFDEIAAPGSYNPRLLRGIETNPDKVEKPQDTLKTVVDKTFRWPGSQEFPMWGYREGPEEQTNSWYIAECGIRMMNRFASGKAPWHLEVHFPEPHDPYMPLKKYLDGYRAEDIPVPESFRDDFRGKPGLHRRESEIWGPVTEKDFQQGRAHYYAYCEQVDAQVGRLLDALDRTGQAANTIVVFTGDHGDMAGAHRMWIKGWFPYEDAYRIPLVIRWPGHTPAGKKCDRLVSSHDLAHTYVAAAGAKSLPFPDGENLLPLLTDPGRKDWRDQLMCAFYGGEFLYTQRIAITSRYKYVFNGFDIDEFYDLEKDPQEMNNAIADPGYRAEVDDMRARLYEMMTRYGDPYGDASQNLSAVQRDGSPPDRYGASRYLPRGKRLGT